MKTYDDVVREDDSTTLHARWITIPASDTEKALAVFLLNPTVRPLLEAVDPKGVEQARNALRLG